MTTNTRPIQFLDYLPEVFRVEEVILQLTVQSIAGTTVTVASFKSGHVDFPIGTPVTAPSKALRTRLTQVIPANRTGPNQIEVQDASFVAALQTDDILYIASFFSRFIGVFETLFEKLEGEIEGKPDRTIGGIPDLFSPDTTPPSQFVHHSQPDFDYLNYLASWIALPLRAEKSESFNRVFFDAAISLYPQRSTLPGMDALLRAWLKGDLLETDPPLLILTDLTRTYNDVDTIFQLAPERDEDRKPGEIYSQIGLNTVLGEGPPFFFIADLITVPTVRELRNPVGLDVFQQAARFLLNAEKPTYTYYQLRLRAHTLQLAPKNNADRRPSEIYAQFEDRNPNHPLSGTTLLWDEPWIFDSDC
jgi:hypothetical protein